MPAVDGGDGQAPLDGALVDGRVTDGFKGDAGPRPEAGADAVPLDAGTRDGLKPLDKSVGSDLKPQGTITVDSPKGGEVWTAGSPRIIAYSVTGSVAKVDVELWKAGQKHSSLGKDLACTPGGNKLAWTLPSTLSSGSDYRIRVFSSQSSQIMGQSAAAFTVANWSYRRSISLDAQKAASSLSQYQVALELDPSTFVYAHAASGGTDLRFSTSASPGASSLPHWVESWDSSGKSKIWVRVPSLPAGTITTIYMFYGMTGAANLSDVNQTFPNRFVSTGSLLLGGSKTYDWFELKPGHTLTLQQGQPLSISARRILINGTVDGIGKGLPGGQSSGQGQGPGGGGGSNDSGGGGGGYGGKGGKGGYDSGDQPGSGGSTYGSSSGTSIEVGSGGGAGNSVAGGAGGGAVELVAHDLVVVGSIQVDGLPGSGGGQSSGGGSGGGILLRGYDVTITGPCSSKGGAGGAGSSSANDGGGGGGGGRFKVYYEKNLNHPGTVSVSGGSGGDYGTAAYGQAGSSGTSTTGLANIRVVVPTIGPETSL